MYDLSTIKTGDGLLVSSKGFLPEMIQLFQKNKYNHEGVFIWLYGHLFVCESDKRGIALTKFDDYLSSNKELLHLQMKVSLDAEKVAEVMLPRCGKVPYDFVNLFIYQPIKYVTGKWIGGNAENSGNRFACAEWHAFVINQILPLLFPNWFTIAPADMYVSELFNKIKIK